MAPWKVARSIASMHIVRVVLWSQLHKPPIPFVSVVRAMTFTPTYVHA